MLLPVARGFNCVVKGRSSDHWPYAPMGHMGGFAMPCGASGWVRRHGVSRRRSLAFGDTRQPRRRHVRVVDETSCSGLTANDGSSRERMYWRSTVRPETSSSGAMTILLP
jgi:hypothetical protein